MWKVTAVVAVVVLWASTSSATPLDDYVWNTPDPTYSWSVNGTHKGNGYTTYTLEVTSQTWIPDPNDLPDKTVWQHWLVINVPDGVPTASTALLYLDGGSNPLGGFPDKNPFILSVTLALGVVTAHLHQIPNEPLYFQGKRKSEDSIIAYTWAKFMNTSNALWPLRLPMVKGAVRGMDTMQAFVKQKIGFNLDSFMVAGGSKRGWTTWLTGLDPRVVAIAPISIDTLNVVKNFNHHWQCYGFWAPAVKDYYEAGITHALNGPEMEKLMEIVDPFYYKDRLKIPKYIISSTGDEFFVPDSSQFYFPDLVGEKYIRYVANAEHSMTGHEPDVAMAMQTFMEAVVWNHPRPKFSWTVDEETQAITVKTETKPHKVILWSAINKDTRDFRWLSGIRPPAEPAWSFETLHDQGDGVYVGVKSPPKTGYIGFVVELLFPGPRDASPDFKFTTSVSVMPKALPFPPCLETHDC